MNEENSNEKRDRKVLRRETDEKLIRVLETSQEQLHIVVSEFVNQSEVVRKDYAEIKSDVKLILQKLDQQVIPKIEEHNKVLFGKPEDRGKTGLVAAVTDNENEIKDVKKYINVNSKWVLGIWGALVTGLNILIALFKKHGS